MPVFRPELRAPCSEPIDELAQVRECPLGETQERADEAHGQENPEECLRHGPAAQIIAGRRPVDASKHVGKSSSFNQIGCASWRGRSATSALGWTAMREDHGAGSRVDATRALQTRYPGARTEPRASTSRS